MLHYSMNDNEIEQINTIDVNVTAESMDAHVICLKENGYNVIKKSTTYLRYVLFFMLGAYSIGTFLQLWKRQRALHLSIYWLW